MSSLSHERVEDEVTRTTAVADRSFDQFYRLHGWVQVIDAGLATDQTSPWSRSPHQK